MNIIFIISSIPSPNNTHIMLEKTCVFFLLLCLATTSFAQSSIPMKWGQISPQDLKMTVYEPDTTAEAVVLCDFGVITVEQYSDEWKCRFTRHRRIKILKEAGFSYADIAIPFYSHKKMEGITTIKGQIFAPDGSKQTLKKSDVFDEKMNDYWSVSKASFPNVQVGSVLEYKYEIYSERISELPEWYFQEEIPVRQSELQYVPAKYFTYTYLFQGGEGMQQINEPDGTILLTGENGNIRIKSNRYVMTDAKALKEEAYITTMDDYRARLRFQLSQVNYPNGQIEKVMSSWPELAKDLEYNDFFGAQYLKKRNFKHLSEVLTPQLESLETQFAKAEFLYQYLGENIEWNGITSLFVESTLDKAFEKKQARTSELNLMLIAMLKQQGITTYPVLTSTRTHGKMYQEYPLLDQFNHVMVYAVLDGKPTIMDVGDPLRPMGYPRVNALNSVGWQVRSPNPAWIDIKAKNGADVFSAKLTLMDDGTVRGKMECGYKGYNAVPERQHYIENENGEHWKERLSEKYPDVTIDSVTFENLGEITKTFKDAFHIMIPEAAQVAGDFLYFSPVLHSNFEENIFKLEKRTYPVDIPYPYMEQFSLKLTIPEGYSVEELPESVNLALPENGGRFRFVVEQKSERELELVSLLRIKKLRYNPFEYHGIKELFDLVTEKHGEQIVLKKIE